MSNCVKYLRNTTYNLKKKLNILIVDDDKEGSDFFKDILEMRGHTVQIVNEGIRTINYIKNNMFDIIFLDCHMGDIDGITLANIIKDIIGYNSLIFAYTGDNSNITINSFKKTGVNGILIKPININKINKILNLFETIKIEKLDEFKTNRIIDGSIIFF